MPTRSFKLNQDELLSDLSVNDKVMLDELAFRILPQLAFEVEFHSQNAVDWQILAIGYLIGKGKTAREATILAKRIYTSVDVSSQDQS